MSWIRKIWPKRAKSKSTLGLEGVLAPAYGQDLQSPDEFITRANKRAVRGDVEGAIADFDAAIELNPAKATTFYNRAYLHNLSGNHQQAILDCTEAIALLPDYDEAFYQRGLARLELGNLDAAIVDLSEVLRLNPFSIKAYYKRASCYAAQNDIQGAIADYTQAILRVPKDSNAYLQRGLFLVKLQEYHTAIEDFSAALSFNPKSADAYYHRGYCYAELGQKEQATQDFNQAMLYDPSQQIADYNRSYALGILKAANNLPPVKTADPAKTADPDTPTVLHDEAVVLSLNSDDSATVTASTQSFITEPFIADSPMAMDGPSSERPPMGALVRQTDVDVLFVEGAQKAETGDFEGAIQAYSQILDYEPDNARAYLERGKSFTALGEIELAHHDLDTAVHCAKQKSLDLMRDYSGTLSETLATLKVNLAKASPPSSSPSQTRNQSIEAEILKYSQVIHRSPLDPEAYFQRAKSRALLGDLDGAIADYTRTISLNPQHREAYYKRGMLLEALGDEEGSTADLNRAIRRRPLILPAISKAQLFQKGPSAQAPPSQIPHNNEPENLPNIEQQEPAAVVDQESAAIHLETQHDDATLNKLEKVELLAEDVADHVDSDPFSIALRRQTLLQPDEVIHTDQSEEIEDLGETLDAKESLNVEQIIDQDTVVPSYFSDLVLEPCTHEGNDPANRFCIHCGQPIELHDDPISQE